MTIFNILNDYDVPFNVQVLCNFYLCDVAMQIKKEPFIKDLKIKTFQEFLKIATGKKIDVSIIEKVVIKVVDSY